MRVFIYDLIWNILSVMLERDEQEGKNLVAALRVFIDRVDMKMYHNGIVIVMAIGCSFRKKPS